MTDASQGLEMQLLNQGLLRVWLPARHRTTHKGDCGHVLVLGGAPGFGGAALLAARFPGLKRDGLRQDDWVLTPHPGEAARLLGCRAAEVEADRLAAVMALRERCGGVVVLKGVGSLIAGPDGVAVCPFGNPGMASGGMGDVLSGVIGALLAQGVPLEMAARLGVLVHARAADLAAADAGERGLLASDLASYARILVNPTVCDGKSKGEDDAAATR